MWFKILVLVFTVFALTEGRSHPPRKTGHTGPTYRDDRIVGGEIAVEGQFPHQVALFENLLGIHSFYCGGSVISSRFVLTAAHCVLGQTPNRFWVRAGEFYLDAHSDNEQEFKAKAFTIHPLYTYEALSNDIAIIEIDGEFTFTDFVQPIPLAKGEFVEPEAGNLTVSGWGGTIEGAPPARRLHFVEVPYISDEDCKVSYPDDIVESMLCAGTKGKDSCQGDSGGPLIQNGELVGAVSWGTGCAREGFPGVYSQVTYFKEFIRNVTGLE